jgi:hypothetical protein
MTDRPDRPRGRVPGVRGCVLRVDTARGVGGGGCLGRKLERSLSRETENVLG